MANGSVVVVVGAVSAGREAVVPLTLLGPGDPPRRVDVGAVVDTGFDGALTLPPPIVAELGLPLRGSRPAFVADGRRTFMDLHRAGVIWGERVRVVPVLAAPGKPLVGMRLLRGHELRVEVTDGGAVEVRRLPSP